jgi:hypothetical protein
MIYSLVIEGLIFAQTDVFGKYLPSRSSIKDAMSRLENINRTDDENRVNEQRFGSLNYKTVVELDKSFNPLRYMTELENNNIVQNYQEWLMNIDKPSFLELSVMYQYNLDRMCQLTGYDFKNVMQENFIIVWYGYLLGNSGHIGIQKIRKELTTLLLVAGGKKHTSSYKMSEKRDDYLYVLKEYKDLVSSVKSFNGFTDDVSSLVESNEEMFILNMAQHEVTLRLVEITERSLDNLSRFLCPFCNDIAAIIRGVKTPSSCSKCKNKYSASTSLKNRRDATNKKIRSFCSSCGKRRICYVSEKEKSCEECSFKNDSLDSRSFWLNKSRPQPR